MPNWFAKGAKMIQNGGKIPFSTNGARATGHP